jgi:hypothetical protein
MRCLSMGVGGLLFVLSVLHEVSHMYSPYDWMWMSLAICTRYILASRLRFWPLSFSCLIGSGMCRPGFSEEPLQVELTLFVRSTVLPQL